MKGAQSPNANVIVRRLKRSVLILPHLQHVHSRMKAFVEAKPDIDEPDHLVVFGETGSGKTRLAQSFMVLYPRVTHKEWTEIPVLYVRVPSKCTVKMLCGEMLRVMGSPFWARGDELQRTHQLVTLLRACRVRLVVLDEVNQMVVGDGAITHYALGDWIKSVFDEAGVSCLMSGTRRLFTLLETNEQLADRFREQIHIEPFSMESGKFSIYKAAIAGMRKQFEEIESIDFTDSDVARTILFAIGGRFRQLRRLFAGAIEQACASARPFIGMNELETSFLTRIFSDARPERNPFHRRFSGLPLTGRGEPYAPGKR